MKIKTSIMVATLLLGTTILNATEYKTEKASFGKYEKVKKVAVTDEEKKIEEREQSYKDDRKSDKELGYPSTRVYIGLLGGGINNNIDYQSETIKNTSAFGGIESGLVFDEQFRIGMRLSGGTTSQEITTIYEAEFKNRTSLIPYVGAHLGYKMYNEDEISDLNYGNSLNTTDGVFYGIQTGVMIDFGKHFEGKIGIEASKINISGDVLNKDKNTIESYEFKYSVNGLIGVNYKF